MKRNVGAQAIKLDPDDEIVSILIMEDDRLGIMSKSGQFIMVTTASIKQGIN